MNLILKLITSETVNEFAKAIIEFIPSLIEYRFIVILSFFIFFRMIYSLKDLAFSTISLRLDLLLHILHVRTTTKENYLPFTISPVS